MFFAIPQHGHCTGEPVEASMYPATCSGYAFPLRALLLRGRTLPEPHSSTGLPCAEPLEAHTEPTAEPVEIEPSQGQRIPQTCREGYLSHSQQIVHRGFKQLTFTFIAVKLGIKRR